MELALPGMNVVTTPARQPAEATTPSALVEAIPRIYGYFYARVGGDRATAEDLTQDAMVAAVRSGAAPQSPVDLMRWLYTISRHKLIDHYRKLGREREHIAPLLEDEQPGLPDLDLERLPVREEVIATLATIPPRHQAAIVLRYLDGCAVDEVAEALFLSRAAADSLLARARATFRSAWIARNGDAR